MIQSGNPNSKTAKPGIPLGNGGPEHKIPAEFRPSLFHKKGVIAAARDNNPEKASSGSQFYLTQGKVFTDAGLIAAVTTSKGEDRDRPLENVTIIKASLIKRKKTNVSSMLKG